MKDPVAKQVMHICNWVFKKKAHWLDWSLPAHDKKKKYFYQSKENVLRIYMNEQLANMLKSLKNYYSIHSIKTSRRLCGQVISLIAQHCNLVSEGQLKFMLAFPALLVNLKCACKLQMAISFPQNLSEFFRQELVFFLVRNIFE